MVFYIPRTKKGEQMVKQPFKYVKLTSAGGSFKGTILRIDEGQFFGMIEASKSQWDFRGNSGKLIQALGSRDGARISRGSSEEYKCSLSAVNLDKAVQEMRIYMQIFGSCSPLIYCFGKAEFIEDKGTFGFYGPRLPSAFVECVAKLQNFKFVEEVQLGDNGWLVVRFKKAVNSALETNLRTIAELWSFPPRVGALAYASALDY